MQFFPSPLYPKLSFFPGRAIFRISFTFWSVSGSFCSSVTPLRFFFFFGLGLGVFFFGFSFFFFFFLFVFFFGLCPFFFFSSFFWVFFLFVFYLFQITHRPGPFCAFCRFSCQKRFHLARSRRFVLVSYKAVFPMSMMLWVS